MVWIRSKENAMETFNRLSMSKIIKDLINNLTKMLIKLIKYYLVF